MSAEVKSLRGQNYDPDAPVETIVALCEEMLEHAKSGNIRALAVATVMKNGATSCGHAMDLYKSGQLAGSIAVMQHGFMNKNFKD